MDSETEQRLRLQPSQPQPHRPTTTFSPVLHIDDNDVTDTNDLIWTKEDRPNVSLSALLNSSSSPFVLQSPPRNASSVLSLLSLHNDDQIFDPPPSSLSPTTSNHQLAVMTRQVWEMTGHWINTLQREVEELENDGILGHAIIRACHELADTIAHLTTQLQQQQQHQQQQKDTDHDENLISKPTVPTSHLDRNQNRNEFFDHSVTSLLLQLEDMNTYAATTTTTNNSNDNDKKNDINSENAVYNIPDFSDIDGIDDNHDTVHIDPIPPVVDLLCDMEQALRSIDEEEANDLADAAITVGHLLVAAMQQVHSQLLPISNDIDPQYTDNMKRNSTSSSYRGIPLQESPNITRLNDDGDANETNIHTDSPMMKSSLSTDATGVPPYTPYTPKRVRCLWPPLQPVAQSIVQYAQCEVIQKQPIYITAPIILTCWPILITSTIIGSGMVVTDNVLQHLYSNVQDHPIIVTSEISMASLLQTMKLGYLTSKAVAKPTLRIVQKQIQRHAPQVQESISYYIHHPIETIQSTIHTLSWCSQQVVHGVGHSIHEWQQQQASNPHDDTLSVSAPMVDADTTITTTTMLQNMSL